MNENVTKFYMLSKAKATDGEWVYGYYDGFNEIMHVGKYNEFEVIPDTVCAYVDSRDKHGIMLTEDDLIIMDGNLGRIVRHDNEWAIDFHDGNVPQHGLFGKFYADDREFVCNIHDACAASFMKQYGWTIKESDGENG